jgi:hypothetical protein
MGPYGLAAGVGCGRHEFVVHWRCHSAAIGRTLSTPASRATRTPRLARSRPAGSARPPRPRFDPLPARWPARPGPPPPPIGPPCTGWSDADIQGIAAPTLITLIIGTNHAVAIRCSWSVTGSGGGRRLDGFRNALASSRLPRPTPRAWSGPLLRRRRHGYCSHCQAPADRRHQRYHIPAPGSFVWAEGGASRKVSTTSRTSAVRARLRTAASISSGSASAYRPNTP